MTFRILKSPREFDYPRAALARLDRQFVPRLLTRVRTALLALRNVDPAQLEPLITRGAPDGVVETLPWAKFRSTLEDGIYPVALMAMHAAPRVLTRHTVRIKKAAPASGIDPLFDLTNPRAVDAARRNTYALVTGLSDDSRAALRVLISAAVAGEYDVRRAARLIRSAIGLNAVQANALRNYEAGLVNAGELSADAIAQRVERQAAAYLRQRADMIARTETLRAVNAGQQEAWRQMLEQGTIDDTAQRVWIASPDACPDCAALDGETVGLEEEFDDGVFLPPDPHPQCRCAVALTFDGGDGSDGDT